MLHPGAQRQLAAAEIEALGQLGVEAVVRDVDQRIAGAGLAIFSAVGIAALYLGFWVALYLLVSRLKLGSIANAATLAATWLVLTLILPALALLAINGAIPDRQGVELTLAKREAVHGGWDKTKAETMQAFFRHYPQYRATKPVEGGFHWKW